MEKGDIQRQYTYSLEDCAKYFFADLTNASRNYPKITLVQPTMDNWLSIVNKIETYLELKKGEGKEINLGTFKGYFLRKLGSIFDVMILFTDVAKEDAKITAGDFRDEREIPDNYTFGQYRDEKLPLLSQVWEQLNTENGREEMRSVATILFGRKILGNTDFFLEYPHTPGGQKAKQENIVFTDIYENLTRETY